jgi:hypothetical protein
MESLHSLRASPKTPACINKKLLRPPSPPCQTPYRPLLTGAKTLKTAPQLGDIWATNLRRAWAGNRATRTRKDWHSTQHLRRFGTQSGTLRSRSRRRGRKFKAWSPARDALPATHGCASSRTGRSPRHFLPCNNVTQSHRILLIWKSLGVFTNHSFFTDRDK